MAGAARGFPWSGRIPASVVAVNRRATVISPARRHLLQPIRDLLDALNASTTFEQASTAVLRPMLAHAETALAASPFAADGRIVRAMVHLRPDGGYTGLVVLEPGATEATAPDLLPSTTTWESIRRDRQATAVDVLLRDHGSSATIHRLLDRDATHLYAVPLRGPRGRILGMVSIEAHCPLATGLPFVWDGIAPTLQLLADIAGPVLVALPSAPREVTWDDPLLPVVGAAMRPMVSLLEVFASQDETILISGATGTGKSRLARWIHSRSARAEAPIEIVDLNTIPPDMQMAELFGWRRGAFTGAVANQEGSVARAAGGTLFIDEIDKFSLSAQAGLLQLLETRHFRVLGDSGRARYADLRFVVGTNADLAAAVADGRFREDLYYRINVLPVRLPPLSARQDEIGPWGRFMLSRRHEEAGKHGPATLSVDAELALAAEPWPGNLRQLDNVIRRSYAMALLQQGATSDSVTVDVAHVGRALGFEGGRLTPVPPGAPSDTTVLGTLAAAAAAFVAETERRSHAGEPPLDLAHLAAIRALVLAHAVEAHGDLREVFLLFGKDKLVQSRNHTKEYRRDRARLEALCDELGVSPPPNPVK
ncbi:MAG: DNA-binding NtrC family response regulator [Myxococcota bacterium]